MIGHIARAAIGLFAAASAHASVAATVPEKTIDGVIWRIESAASFGNHVTVAAQGKENLLVWTNGKHAEAADSALLLVEAPYEQVQPAVQRALVPLGRFTINAKNDPLAYLPNGWDEVLLSRRADLRNMLAERFALPPLQRAVAQGVLTPREMEQRLAQARARVDSAPQDRAELEAFSTTYGNWHAIQQRNHGLTGKYGSVLAIDVFDTSALFGHPTTAVRISRRESYPNRGATWRNLRNFNVLGSPESTVLEESVVPASVFLAVRDTLAGIPGKLEIARTPQAWALPVPPAVTPPTLMLTVPTRDAPSLEAQSIRWDVLVADQRSPLYPHDLLTLPGGDLLLSAEVSDGSGRSQHIWRLHDAKGEWTAEAVWRGAEGARQLSLSADGRFAWFDGTDTRDAAPHLYTYDTEARRVIGHEVKWPDNDRHDLSSLRWELAGDQQPAIFGHDYTYDESKKDSLGNDFLSVLRPATPPSSRDDAWSFRPAFASARQSMMGVRMKGNALIWPVRWRDPKTFWVEDQPGVAELDAASGRVLRAWAMPQRFGSPDNNDATGVAQWVPKPLGSPEAGWIATDFVLMLHDNGYLPPTWEDAAHQNDRFVGMHVISLEDGRVWSALLGRSDTLEAAARSARGRFLALGSNGPPRESPRVALWDVQQARTPLQLHAISTTPVHALAFSWNGADLWALGDRELLHWPLPRALQDAATQGSFPEQSHN